MKKRFTDAIPAAVTRVQGGDYVVTAVGDHPQVKPERQLRIRKERRKWRLEVDDILASRHGTLRLARIAASDPNVRQYSNLSIGDHAKRRAASTKQDGETMDTNTVVKEATRRLLASMREGAPGTGTVVETYRVMQEVTRRMFEIMREGGTNSMEMFHGRVNVGASVVIPLLAVYMVVETLHDLGYLAVRLRGGDIAFQVVQREWDEAQVKAFVLEAVTKHRPMFDLVPSLRRAVIAEQFTVIVTSLASDSIPVGALKQLWEDMCTMVAKLEME